MTTSLRSSISWWTRAFLFATRTARVLEMTTYLVGYDLLYAIGMKWVWRVMRWQRQGETVPSATAIASAARAQEIASALYVKPVRCLQRAVVTTWYLRRRGCACVLVVGAHVARKEGHAWVETAGQVIGDPRFLRRYFRPLTRA